MAIAGKNGKVIIGDSGSTKVVGIKSWSLELSLDTLETTALGDDWKKYIAGLKEWSASSEDPVDDVVNISIEFTGNGVLIFEKGTGDSND
jgi:hypothetical protein|nr:MAG TPA: major tail protein [Caudoviricetes sp.]